VASEQAPLHCRLPAFDFKAPRLHVYEEQKEAVQQSEVVHPLAAQRLGEVLRVKPPQLKESHEGRALQHVVAEQEPDVQVGVGVIGTKLPQL